MSFRMNSIMMIDRTLSLCHLQALLMVLKKFSLYYTINVVIGIPGLYTQL
jgi:hypothetical protein